MLRSNILKWLLETLVCVVLLSSTIQAQDPINIGSKLFTESIILGQIATQLAEVQRNEAEFYEQLGGTRILWNALLEGEIDIYPEYTGTLIQEILRSPEIQNFESLRDTLATFGISTTEPFGFNNTYALGMKKEVAEAFNIKSISDLKNHPELEYGFTNEFIDRADGWVGLRQIYDLSTQKVTGLDHDLSYRGLEQGDIDVIDLYSTDAEIKYYELTTLIDDRAFFPEYQAMYIYRTELETTHAELINALKSTGNTISDAEMVAMNASVKLEGDSDAQVASNYIKKTFQIDTLIKEQTVWSNLRRNTLGHLYLVGISLGLAIIFAIPVGILAVKMPRIENYIISTVGILQTIPSLALLVFMIPFLGIGALPAMAALFLYSLLPIVRNTHAGIKNIPDSIMESAYALGLPNSVVLKKIELPLALPSILAGIKTSAVINVGTATLGALIGAGGYGQPILTGIRLDDTSLILQGAIPAAILALLVQGIFDLVERKYVKY